MSRERSGWRDVPQRHPWAVVLSWGVVAAVLVVFAPSLGEVAVRDDAEFLPASAPSQRAEAALTELFPGDIDRRTAVAVFVRPGGLRGSDRAFIARITKQLAGPAHRGDVTAVVTATSAPEQAPVLRSADGEAELVILSLRGAPFSEEASQQLDRVRGTLDANTPPGLRHAVTGPAALAADQAAAVLESFERTAAVTVVLVLGILVLVYRSLVAPFVPLITIAFAFVVARGVVALMADHGFDVAAFTETFMIVLVFGAGTDYCLLLVSRYREELAKGGSLARTMHAVTGVIAASAATVIAGQLAMGAARFGMVRTMGPSVALAIAVTLVASVTLTPALVRLVGSRLFWPGRLETPLRRDTPFSRLGTFVTRRPAVSLAGGLALLAVLALGVAPMRASLDAVDDLPSAAGAKQGFALLSDHFPGGRLSPVSIVVRTPAPVLDDGTFAAIDRLTDRLRDEPGVAEVRSVTQPAGEPLTAANVATLGADLDPATIGLGDEVVAGALGRLQGPAGLRLDAELVRSLPTLRDHLAPLLGTDGRSTRLLVTLRGNPYNADGFAQVRRITAVSQADVARAVAGAEVLVGGPVSLSIDMKDINDADFRRIAVLLAVGVTVVLGLLLRSLVAPLYLLAAILLAFAATLGIVVTIFQAVLGHAGISSPAPTFLFVILVALGADYSIFLTARIREEVVAGATVRQAAWVAVVHAGPVVVAAATILAGTFAALLTVDMPLLRQVGVAVTIGVFLDAALACTVVIPAATVLAGSAAFWPGLRREPTGRLAAPDTEIAAWSHVDGERR